MIFSFPWSLASWVFTDHVEERLALFMLDRIEGALQGGTDLFRGLDPLPVTSKGLADLFVIGRCLQLAQWKMICPNSPAFRVDGTGSPLYRMPALIIINNDKNRELVSR